MRQTCKVCGRVDKFDFTVPDAVWMEVVPVSFLSHVVCLSCFDDFATLRDLDYAQSLDTLYFAGDKASLEFCRVLMTDYESFKAKHPFLLRWEEFKLRLSELWWIVKNT